MSIVSPDYFVEEYKDMTYECFLQAPFEQSCKIKMYNIACPKCTKLQQGAPAQV